jgi:hypothetical protein
MPAVLFFFFSASAVPSVHGADASDELPTGTSAAAPDATAEFPETALFSKKTKNNSSPWPLSLQTFSHTHTISHTLQTLQVPHGAGLHVV